MNAPSALQMNTRIATAAWKALASAVSNHQCPPAALSGKVALGCPLRTVRRGVWCAGLWNKKSVQGPIGMDSVKLDCIDRICG
jgi:hypothetical protein